MLSSDRPPDSIPTLEDRLRSRFKMGLITDIQPPDLETRMAILRKKAERDPYGIHEEVLTFIAENITDNIRELEGALIRVTAYSSLPSRPQVDLAARAGRHRQRHQPPPNPPPDTRQALRDVRFPIETSPVRAAATLVPHVNRDVRDARPPISAIPPSLASSAGATTPLSFTL